MRRYPRSQGPAVRYAAERYEEILSARTCIEDAATVIMRQVRARKWDLAAETLRSVITVRATILDGTVCYPNFGDIGVTLERIGESLRDKHIEDLENALQELSAGASRALDAAAEEDPGEEGSDWQFQSMR